jgi:hypothetical protein
MVKLVILLLTGLSNQFEPSMVFDPSEFEAPRFFLLRNIGKIDRTFKSIRAIHGIRPIQVRGTEVFFTYFLPSIDLTPVIVILYAKYWSDTSYSYSLHQVLV